MTLKPKLMDQLEAIGNQHTYEVKKKDNEMVSQRPTVSVRLVRKVVLLIVIQANIRHMLTFLLI